MKSTYIFALVVVVYKTGVASSSQKPVKKGKKNRRSTNANGDRDKWREKRYHVIISS